ncbi:MAG TPA: hypothetical protein VI564_05085 [Candidatus Nanoarchaeia archaeon]|nr:hypothetical protein [Candidatus Nanoarchaeia archaeon]
MHLHKTNEKGSFLQKLRKSSYLMILVCIVPILLLFAGSYYFGFENNILLSLVFLAACVLGHVFMMKNHNH